MKPPASKVQSSILRTTRSALVGIVPSVLFLSSGPLRAAEPPLPAPVEASPIRLHEQLRAAPGRLAGAVHFVGDAVHLWGCAEKCAAAVPTLSLKLPEGVEKLRRRVDHLRSPEGGTALLIRYGDDKEFYSLLFVGAPVPSGVPEKAPISDPVSLTGGAIVPAPTLLMRGWAGPDSKTQMGLSLTSTKEGSRLVLSTMAEERVCGRAVAQKTRVLALNEGQFEVVRAPILSASERQAAKKLVAVGGATEEGRLFVRLLPPTSEKASPATDADRVTPWAKGHDLAQLRPPEGAKASLLVIEMSEPLSAPAKVFIATAEQVYEVEFAPSTDRIYSVEVPEEKDLCVALIQSSPAVPVAEVMASVAVEKTPTTAELVGQLDKGDPGMAPHALVLRGAHAAEALAAGFGRMSALGRGRSLEVASQLPGPSAAPFFAAVVENGNAEQQALALEHLRVSEAPGAEAIVARLKKSTAASEGHLADALVALSPALAARTLPPRLATQSPARRLYLRRAVGKLAEDKEGSAKMRSLVSLLAEGKTNLSRPAQVELARALGPQLKSWGKPATQFVESLAKSADFSESYRLAPHVLDLAPDSPELTRIFLLWLKGESEKELTETQSAALSVRTLDLLIEVERAAMRAAFRDQITGLLASPNMRVRRAALVALERLPGRAPASEVLEILASDEWPQVRSAAAGAAIASPRGVEQDERLSRVLSKRLAKDEHSGVRRSVARALVEVGDERAVESLRKAFAKDDAYDVRGEAAIGLGKLCDHASLEALTEVARELSRAPTNDGMISLSLDSVTALTHLAPSDLDERLRPTLSKNVSGIVRNQVKLRRQAVQESPGGSACQKSEGADSAPKK